MPAPFGPMMETIWCEAMDKERPFKASRPPNRSVISRISRIILSSGKAFSSIKSLFVNCRILKFRLAIHFSLLENPGDPRKEALGKEY